MPYPQDISPRRLDTRGAAHYTGSTESTLEKLRCYGKGPAFIKLGKRVVYDIADLDIWLNAGRRTSTSDTGEGASS